MASDPTLPIPDRDSAPYWAALAEGRLELQHCADCGAWSWPARPICSKCHGENIAWEPVAGTGTVHAWVVPQRAFFPRLKDLVPFAIVAVKPDEQDDIIIPARFTGDPASVTQGMAVRATTEKLTDETGELLWEAVA
jgi:uncharacterized OB-fold protein